jgi:hypothetical protein
MSVPRSIHSHDRSPAASGATSRARAIPRFATRWTRVAGCCLAFGLSSIAAPAFSQSVTLAELQGAKIEFSSVHRERLIRGGQDFYVDLHTAGNVTVGPGDAITSSFTNTSFRDGRSPAGSPTSGTFTLGKPGKGGAGGDILWLFSEGSLTRLMVYSGGEGGGQKLNIRFSHSPEGLRCSFSMPFARENGVGTIRKGSAVDGVPIKILEWKPVSSSCRVTKR